MRGLEFALEPQDLLGGRGRALLGAAHVSLGRGHLTCSDPLRGLSAAASAGPAVSSMRSRAVSASARVRAASPRLLDALRSTLREWSLESEDGGLRRRVLRSGLPLGLGLLLLRQEEDGEHRMGVGLYSTRERIDLIRAGLAIGEVHDLRGGDEG